MLRGERRCLLLWGWHLEDANKRRSRGGRNTRSRRGEFEGDFRRLRRRGDGSSGNRVLWDWRGVERQRRVLRESRERGGRFRWHNLREGVWRNRD